MKQIRTIGNNKIYLTCSLDFPVSDDILYGTGISKSCHNPNIFMAKEKIIINYKLRKIELIVNNDDIVGQILNEIMENIDPSCVFPVYYTENKEEREMMREKGYDWVLSEKSGEIDILCRYHPRMKYYKYKTSLFGNDFEYYQNYGGRELYL